MRCCYVSLSFPLPSLKWLKCVLLVAENEIIIIWLLFEVCSLKARTEEKYWTGNTLMTAGLTRLWRLVSVQLLWFILSISPTTVYTPSYFSILSILRGPGFYLRNLTKKKKHIRGHDAPELLVKPQNHTFVILKQSPGRVSADNRKVSFWWICCFETRCGPKIYLTNILGYLVIVVFWIGLIKEDRCKYVIVHIIDHCPQFRVWLIKH